MHCYTIQGVIAKNRMVHELYKIPDCVSFYKKIGYSCILSLIFITVTLKL